jgi:hypothetical protein
MNYTPFSIACLHRLACSSGKISSSRWVSPYYELDFDFTWGLRPGDSGSNNNNTTNSIGSGSGKGYYSGTDNDSCQPLPVKRAAITYM